MVASHESRGLRMLAEAEVGRENQCLSARCGTQIQHTLAWRDASHASHELCALVLDEHLVAKWRRYRPKCTSGQPNGVGHERCDVGGHIFETNPLEKHLVRDP